MRILLLALILAVLTGLAGCSSGHVRLHTYKVLKTFERETHPDLDLLLNI